MEAEKGMKQKQKRKERQERRQQKEKVNTAMVENGRTEHERLVDSAGRRNGTAESENTRMRNEGIAKLMQPETERVRTGPLTCFSQLTKEEEHCVCRSSKSGDWSNQSGVT